MDDGEAILQRLLLERFYHSSEGALSAAQRADLAVHLRVRVDKFRRFYAPWIRSRVARGARVLEVGVGTGCAALVLAELGLVLDGIEPIRDHALIASERLRLAGHGFAQLVD